MKIQSYLKTAVVCLAMSALLFSCEQEENAEDIEQKEMQADDGPLDLNNLPQEICVFCKNIENDQLNDVTLCREKDGTIVQNGRIVENKDDIPKAFKRLIEGMQSIGFICEKKK